VVGQTISHYRILKKLGEGGMGVVYTAEDTRLGRTVALKFLAPHLLRDDEARKRFEHEARAAAALDHPNICTVYEIDEDADKTFIALAYMEGQTLSDKISQGPLDLSEVLAVGHQLVEGLVAAHEHGVVHRDVKPDNIMLIKGSRGLVKIMDFGLAQLSGASRVTREGSTLGTVAYMSPEQVEGSNVDHRSDLWAVGAVLYEMISGQRPFQGEFDQAVVYSILNEQPKPLTAVRTGVSQELERIVGKCLAKDPEARYQRAEDMRVDLENLKREGRKIEVRPAPRVTKAAARPRLNFPAIAAVLAIGAAGVWLNQGSGEKGKEPMAGKEGPSIAILPFVNSSGDPNFEYFADGMTDELINALSRVDGLRVLSRSSVFRFKGERYDIKDVAAELGVDNVLEGTVRRDGERLRITAQMINAADGFELWAGRFDRRMEAVFDIQDEVTAEMVRNLRSELGGNAQAPAAKRPTAVVAAYDACLRGEFEQFRLDLAGVEKSLTHFEEAIRLDPGFARAYAGLARSYTNLAIFGGRPAAEVADEARRYAARAVGLDDKEARAHSAAAYVARMIEWDWEAAGESYQRALALNPADADTRGSYASYLRGIGRDKQGMAESERSLEQEPLSPSVNRRLVMQYNNAGRFEDVIRQARRTLELDPRSSSSRSLMAAAQIELGETEAGIKALEELRSGRPDHTLAYYYARLGRRDEALAIAEELKKRREAEYVPPMRLAQVYAGLRDLDAAFRWAGIAIDEHEPGIERLNSFHYYKEMREDPRYEELIRRIGFPN